VQTNYGGKLVIDGVPVWKELTPPPRERGGGDLPPKGGSHMRLDLGGSHASAKGDLSPVALSEDDGAKGDGSCMIVVATDAPLDARNLERLAARAIFALARTGSTYSNGSGDFAIAFSTHPSLRVAGTAAPQARTILPTDGVSGLFEAVLDATEEAVDNSLLKAADVTANGRTIRALPVEPLKALLKKYGRGAP
jgi:D-aminopeptidase